jgi:hypothetical protein
MEAFAFSSVHRLRSWHAAFCLPPWSTGRGGGSVKFLILAIGSSSTLSKLVLIEAKTTVAYARHKPYFSQTIYLASFEATLFKKADIITFL